MLIKLGNKTIRQRKAYLRKVSDTLPDETAFIDVNDRRYSMRTTMLTARKPQDNPKHADCLR